MDTSKWTSALDKTTQAFANEFGGLTSEQLNWKPNADTWSVAQNIDHLMVINATYFPVIESVKNNSYKLPWIGRIGFMVNFFGNFILKSVQPDGKRRMKTFPIWEPATSSIGTDILGRFKQHQERIKVMIVQCSDLLDRGVVISSPANSSIVYKLEKAFDIIVAHEQRHLEQARELYRQRLVNS